MFRLRSANAPAHSFVSANPHPATSTIFHRKPKLRVIQSASVPDEPWRPNYHRDAAIVVAGALILGWLAAWLADFLVRRESGPTVIVAPTPVPYPIAVPELAQHSTPILGAPPSSLRHDICRASSNKPS